VKITRSIRSRAGAGAEIGRIGTRQPARVKGDQNSLPLLGWREWVGLPELGVERLKAKIDTGAHSSALHAFFVEVFEEHGRARVRFGLHPLQRRSDIEKICITDMVDERLVSDSGGHRERRVVIRTEVVLGSCRWPTELTLTNRDTMRFRMLLGRTALNKRFWVNPAVSYLAGQPLAGN
jgi:Uncharacterized protein conserved in archaea